MPLVNFEMAVWAEFLAQFESLDLHFVMNGAVIIKENCYIGTRRIR